MAGYEDISRCRWLGLSSLSMSCRSALGRKAALSTFSILVALLIAGQAVTVYFVYQQSGQISKLTKTTQNLQLEALQRKLPASAKPVSKMKMAMVNTPLAMRVMPLAPSVGNMVRDDMAPASNKTEDQVKHLLLQADPKNMFPELKDNLMGNMKTLKNTMTDADWKSFESWMHKWLLFEMAKNPKEQDQKAIPAQKARGYPKATNPPSPDHGTSLFHGNLWLVAFGTSQSHCPLPAGHLGRANVQKAGAPHQTLSPGLAQEL
uniref:CD74 molecule n=1 Tax=Strix occidentalis caurina TaxID=311401 RepID=A0A8D0F4R7_STROC